MATNNFYSFASLRESRIAPDANGHFDLSRSTSSVPLNAQTSRQVSSIEQESTSTVALSTDGDDTRHVQSSPEGEDEPYKKDEQRYKFNSRIFLCVSVLSALLILAFEIYMFTVINLYKASIVSKAKYSEISIYLALFIFSGFYQIILTIIGLRTKNLLLLAMLCIFYMAMLVYTGIQYNEVSSVFSKALDFKWRHSMTGTNIATIAVLGVTMVIQVGLLYFVLRENVRWFRFKKIGADLRIRRMYTIFQLHRALLIFDFYFFIGFTVQFIVIMIKNKSSVEFILTVCVLPFTLLLLFLSDLACTREILLLTIFTITGFLLGCVYVLFKIIRLFTKYTSAFDIGIEPGSYFPGRKSLVTFGVITLILLITTIVFEVWVSLNYGEGLLPLVSTYYKWVPGHREIPERERPLQDLQPEVDVEKTDDEDDESLLID